MWRMLWRMEGFGKIGGSPRRTKENLRPDEHFGNYGCFEGVLLTGLEVILMQNKLLRMSKFYHKLYQLSRNKQLLICQVKLKDAEKDVKTKNKMRQGALQFSTACEKYTEIGRGHSGEERSAEATEGRRDW